MTIENPTHPNIVLMQPSDHRWEEFIRNQPDTTIFHYPAWIKLLAECYGFQPFVIAACDDDGIIRAGIPVMEIKRSFAGRRWVSLPFSDYCNPLSIDPVWLNYLIEGLVNISKQKNIPNVEIRWNLPPGELIHPSAHYVLHTLELDSNINKVCKCVHRTQYQNVRRAEKEGIQIERGRSLEDMRTFYRLHCLTRKRHGLPVQPWRFFELLYSEIMEKELGFILLGRKSNLYLSAGIFLCAGRTLSYKYSASNDKEDQKYRSNHLLTWEAICWGCENGFTRFDFGRSDLEDTGLRNYKIRWGAEETMLNYSYFFGSPKLQAVTKLMPLMIFIIHNSPLWVDTTLGNLIYKYFE
jgi:Acetyltransferase (GNAT) domain